MGIARDSKRFGLMALSNVSNQYLDGQAYMNCADTTAADVDAEVKELLASCYEDAKTILVEHRELLDEVAMFLLQKETITGDELMTYVNAENKKLPETTGSDQTESPVEAAEVSDGSELPAEAE